MELPTATCVLRPFRLKDADSIARHANNRAVSQNLRDVFPYPYSVADAEKYISHVAAQPRLTSFAIDVDGSAVGGISLRPCTDVERLSAEIGYWLGEQYWGRGIMLEAVRSATSYAFAELQLIRVFALPFAHNLASVRLLERAGYMLEGRLRRSVIKNGEIYDQYLYAAVQP